MQPPVVLLTVLTALPILTRSESARLSTGAGAAAEKPAKATMARAAGAAKRILKVGGVGGRCWKGCGERRRKVGETEWLWDRDC